MQTWVNSYAGKIKDRSYGAADGHRLVSLINVRDSCRRPYRLRGDLD